VITYTPPRGWPSLPSARNWWTRRRDTPSLSAACWGVIRRRLLATVAIAPILYEPLKDCKLPVVQSLPSRHSVRLGSVRASRLPPTGVCVFCFPNYAGREGGFRSTPKETRTEPLPLAQSSAFRPIPYADCRHQNRRSLAHEPMNLLPPMTDIRTADCVVARTMFTRSGAPCRDATRATPLDF
jgi:hypothetical protein